MNTNEATGTRWVPASAAEASITIDGPVDGAAPSTTHDPARLALPTAIRPVIDSAIDEVLWKLIEARSVDVIPPVPESAPKRERARSAARRPADPSREASRCTGDHLKTAQVAGYAGCCIETVLRHRKAGTLRACGGVGGRFVFDRTEVERWFKGLEPATAAGALAHVDHARLVRESVRKVLGR